MSYTDAPHEANTSGDTVTFNGYTFTRKRMTRADRIAIEKAIRPEFHAAFGIIPIQEGLRSSNPPCRSG